MKIDERKTRQRPTQTSSLTFRIEPPLQDILANIAREEDRTVSSLARILIREALVYRMGGTVDDAHRGAMAGDRVYDYIVKAWELIRQGLPTEGVWIVDPHRQGGSPQ